MKRLIGGIVLVALVFGAPLTGTLEGQQTKEHRLCGACLGVGKLQGWCRVTCPQCKGRNVFWTVCARCKGRGTVTKRCLGCLGRGYVTRYIETFDARGNYIQISYEQTCFNCAGTGRERTTCVWCKGAGEGRARCRRCRGTGQITYWGYKICSYCRGTGYYRY